MKTEILSDAILTRRIGRLQGAQHRLENDLAEVTRADQDVQKSIAAGDVTNKDEMLEELAVNECAFIVISDDISTIARMLTKYLSEHERRAGLSSHARIAEEAARHRMMT